MTEAHTLPFTSVNLIEFKRVEVSIAYYAKNESVTNINVIFGKKKYVATLDRPWFPLSWLNMCVSADTVSGNVRLIVQGQVVDERVLENIKNIPVWQDGAFLTLGTNNNKGTEYPGMVSNINIFSSCLSIERMIAMTEGGSDLCGAPGDYLSWEEADWKVEGQAVLKMVKLLEDNFPCRRESKVTMYEAEFQKASSCMSHCEKIGNGRSPPIRTQQEWNWLTEEKEAISPEGGTRHYSWLAAEERSEEGVWKLGG